tara:strand:+ start:451 stop:681 length:231 start_codon:yes stop_codon:yes gene_type:complete
VTFQKRKKSIIKLDVDLDDVPEHIQLQLFLTAIDKTANNFVMRNGMIDKTEAATHQNKITHNFKFYVKTWLEREEI